MKAKIRLPFFLAYAFCCYAERRDYRYHEDLARELVKIISDKYPDAKIFNYTRTELYDFFRTGVWTINSGRYGRMPVEWSYTDKNFAYFAKLVADYRENNKKILAEVYSVPEAARPVFGSIKHENAIHESKITLQTRTAYLFIFDSYIELKEEGRVLREYGIYHQLQLNKDTHKAEWVTLASEKIKSSVKVLAATEAQALETFKRIEGLDFLELAKISAPNGDAPKIANAIYLSLVRGLLPSYAKLLLRSNTLPPVPLEQVENALCIYLDRVKIKTRSTTTKGRAEEIRKLAKKICQSDKKSDKKEKPSR